MQIRKQSIALLINCLHFFGSHKNSSESYESIATVGTKLGVLSPQHHPFILFYYLSFIKKVRIWDKRLERMFRYEIYWYIFLLKIFLFLIGSNRSANSSQPANFGQIWKKFVIYPRKMHDDNSCLCTEAMLEKGQQNPPLCNLSDNTVLSLIQ